MSCQQLSGHGPAEAEPGDGTDRLPERLAAVEARISAACAEAGRPRAAVTLIAVGKTRPATDLRRLAGLGVSDFGENRDQEAAPKAATLADLSLRWHFVGRLQTNKCRSVARYAAVVHSVDRPDLVGALGTAARRAGRPLTALVQVSLDGDPGRGGALPADIPRLADAIVAEDGLELGGVMGIAPLGGDPVAAFAKLAEVADRVRSAYPQAAAISAGMTDDLEPAIAAGATYVRVGTALFGRRPPPLR